MSWRSTVTSAWLAAAVSAGCGRSMLDEPYEAPPDGPIVPLGGAPSCATPGPGIDDCGPNHESCCTTLPVPGGRFLRSFDGVSCPGGPDAAPPPALGCYTKAAHPAVVSGFLLDKYLVTVARYRAYLASVRASGWVPTPGSGRHTHLNGGAGLVDVGRGGLEGGWSADWADDRSVTEEPADNDNTVPHLPINGMSWSQAYAFCIWDGGFLPSEAEWNYAASGGDQQRVYPWSQPPGDATLSCARAAYTQPGDPNACVMSGAYWVGAKSPAGDGRWGHTDLAGSRGEWTLDWLRDYVDPCVDCANLQQPPGVASHVMRGYSHVGPTAPPRLLTSLRSDDAYGWIGFRCARSPQP
jgi:formylglycine-generating enzyme required for sulfatase activity